jgi:hypothetical protein
MKLHDIKPLSEASYPGNIGMMEMFKFYQIASEEDKKQMKELISKKLFDAAWQLLQKVTGVNLHPN